MTNELNYESVLLKSTNRAIFQAFFDNEVARMDEQVYTPLEKRYPSLEGLLNGFKNGYDPIAKHEEDKFIMRLFADIAEIANSVKLIDEYEYSQLVVKPLIDMTSPMLELYAKYAPFKEDLYVAIIRAAKEVGQSGKPVELFEDLDYSDEVQRKAIPTRGKAETFLKINQIYETIVFDAKRSYMDFTLERNDIVEEKLEEILEECKLIPSARAVKALHEAVREYKAEEFDRIYGWK